MNITKGRLKQIIQEELSRTSKEPVEEVFGIHKYLSLIHI